jgi:hypothetical protein
LRHPELIIRKYPKKYDLSEGISKPVSFEKFKNLSSPAFQSKYLPLIEEENLQSERAGRNQDVTSDSQKTDATTEQPITSSAEAPLAYGDVARLDFSKESEQGKDANSTLTAGPSVILSAPLAEETSRPSQTGGNSPDGESANSKLDTGEQVICDGNAGVIVVYVYAILGLSFLKSILTTLQRVPYLRSSLGSSECLHLMERHFVNLSRTWTRCSCPRNISGTPSLSIF